MTSNGRGVKRLSGWAGCETLCSASQLPSQTCTTKHISSTHPSFWACLWHWKRRFWKGGVSQSCLGGQTQSVWKNDVMKLDAIVVLLHFRTVGLFWKGGFGTRGAQESWRKVGWNLSQIYWLNITVRWTRIFCAMVHGCGRSINETSHMTHDCYGPFPLQFLIKIIEIWPIAAMGHFLYNSLSKSLKYDRW